MEHLQIKNWNDSSNLTDVYELSEKDNKCLVELQKVIEGFGLESKFGISLLHKHFDINDEEVLLETNNPALRELRSIPVPASAVKSDSYAVTAWRFDSGFRYGCFFCKKDHCDTDQFK